MGAVFHLAPSQSVVTALIIAIMIIVTPHRGRRGKIARESSFGLGLPRPAAGLS